MKRRDLIQAAAAGISLAGIPMELLAQQKGVINAVVQPEPPGLMLGIVQNGPVQLVSGNIYEGLLRFDEKINPLPSLATSWTTNKEGTVYTFKLKPGVLWHDGKPFTSADVVFSIDVLLRKHHIRARGNLFAVESIKALDPLTVEFTLKYPFGPFLSILEVGSMPMVPKHIYEGTDFQTNPANATPIGTGPYKFREWVKGSYIHLVANDRYHVAGLPKISDVYFHVIPDAASRSAAFESGKVDVLPGGAVEFFEVARLGKLPGAAVSTKGFEFFAPQALMWMNNRRGPTANVKFRQAIMHAIDRQAICNIAFAGFAKPATSPFNSHLKFHSPELKYTRNLDAARKLLAEAGYRGETLRMVPLPYGETWVRTAEIVKQQLAQAGVKADIVATDVAGYNQKMGEWDYDFAFTYLYQYGDPAVGLPRNFHSSNILKGQPFNNIAGYNSPKIDALFDAGAREVDLNKRRAIYLDMQRTLVEDVPVAWLFEIEFPTVYRAKFKNLISSAIGLNDSLAGASIG